MSAHRHPAARRALGAVLLAGLGLLLGGCGERAQELQVKGPDAHPFQGARQGASKLGE